MKSPHSSATKIPPATVTLTAKGHANIKGTHKKTFELVTDSELSDGGTCIIGVATEPQTEHLLQLRGSVKIELQCGTATDTVHAMMNPLYIASDPLIIRTHGEPQHNSLCIGANKGAAALDRELIDALRAPGAELTMTLSPLAAHTDELVGCLFIVAMPIGNRDDLSPRARATLASVDIILAEDTRTTRAMLGRLRADYISFHNHNEQERVPEILERLANGSKIALVSDAGTPLVSDPGFPIVRAAAAAGHLVIPLPGPDAVTAALSVSGLPTNDYRFLGFLPRKTGERASRIAQIKEADYTCVVFEAPHRMIKSLEAIAGQLGNRPLALCRNMTKPGEEFLRGTAHELAALLQTRDAVRGEFAIVIGPGEIAINRSLTGELRNVAKSLLANGVATKIVAAAMAEATGAPKRDMFNAILTLKD